MSECIVLVSCVSMKLSVAAAARDLYTSPYFRGMRRYAEREGQRWYVLSALHGVVSPEEVIEPYNQTLNKMGMQARKDWAARVQKQLMDLLPPRAHVAVLAGRRYSEDVVPFLEAQGFDVELPMGTMKIGERLRWLNDRNANA